jgi:peptide/nickel transport system permease protein
LTEVVSLQTGRGGAEALPGVTARLWRFVRRNPSLVAGAIVLLVFAALAVAAPWLPGDPLTMVPSRRLLPPGREFPFGTDALGRDVLARTVHGARVSLTVGFLVAGFAIAIGLVIGLLAGGIRKLDGPLMRLMDTLMAIPAILLAIALISLTRASVTTVIIAITIPEIPRVVRLVRSVVLSVRDLPYVEAAIAGGARLPKIILRHILPSTVPPLIVQATYICASAMLVEATLSFLGAGSPPEIPSWGNMIASSRLYIARAPWTIFCPGAALALIVLAVNLVGDGLRDRLDPRLARSM